MIVSSRLTAVASRVQCYLSCVKFAISARCVEVTPYMCQKYFLHTIPAVALK
jgi:hypothetical protein